MNKCAPLPTFAHLLGKEFIRESNTSARTSFEASNVFAADGISVRVFAYYNIKEDMCLAKGLKSCFILKVGRFYRVMQVVTKGTQHRSSKKFKFEGTVSALIGFQASNASVAMMSMRSRMRTVV